MKFRYFCILMLALLFSACGPGQKIINSWINPEAGSREPYKSIFIIVML